MQQTAAPSFYWYDLETSGTDPKWDRIIQFAGIRTDTELNELDESACEYVQLPLDVLPHPMACLVTGLTPQLVNAKGLPEFTAMQRIAQRFGQPGTCVAGFNSLRFDDEFIRYGFYRHLLDPYAREWQGGNSRWDIIDLVRAAGALRPEGINWPQDMGLPVYRLEALTAANGIAHGQAHDALSDVRATIGLARLLRQQQPKLFQYYLSLRQRAQVLQLLRPARPSVCVHVSGHLPREQFCAAPIMPLLAHPQNRNAIIVVDLLSNLEPLLNLEAEALSALVFAPQQGPALRLKEVRANRVPFVAPMNVLRPEDWRRLGWQQAQIERNFQRLLQANQQGALTAKLTAMYQRSPPSLADDVDAGLYQGFIGDTDRARCNAVLAQLREGVPVPDPGFADSRLSALLFRLRARAGALDPVEQQHWREFVRAKLEPADPVPWLSLADYVQAIAQAEAAVSKPADAQLLQQLRAHGATVQAWLAPTDSA